MTFLADEGIDRQIVDCLRQDGYVVDYVAELDPGISDETVLGRSRQGQSVLITSDKDFGELVHRQRQATTGVLLVRLAGLTPAVMYRCPANCLVTPSRRIVTALVL